MAKSERSGKIQTVLGLIEPEQLEVTITHILDTGSVIASPPNIQRGFRHFGTLGNQILSGSWIICLRP